MESETITETPRIMVVDDDVDIVKILTDNLELDNYRVVAISTGKEALEVFQESSIDLIILDLTLPDMDGIQVCRLLRDKSTVPIIMLTARDRVPDKVLGLESGADDYMSKPFDYLELAARIKARLRRKSHTSEKQTDLIRIRDLMIDLGRKTVSKKGRRIVLTNREFNLLVFLSVNLDRAMDRTSIKKALWPEGDIYKDSRALDVHIQHLRSKIEDNPATPTFVVTVQGVGYMLRSKLD